MTTGAERGPGVQRGADAAVAEVKVRRTGWRVVVLVVWTLLVVVGLARGWASANNDRFVWFALGMCVTVASALVLGRGLWRNPQRIVWTIDGELVRWALSGRRVVDLEPPIQVRVCESDTLLDVVDVVITSAGESIALAADALRATQAVRLAAAVAEGTGSPPPRREVLRYRQRRTLRQDQSLRWCDLGDRRPAMLWTLVGVFMMALTGLALAVDLAPPSPADQIGSADEEVRSLDITRDALIADLRDRSSVDRSPAADVDVQAVDVACGRRDRDDELWGPADESTMRVVATVTLPADVPPLVVGRLDGVAKPRKYSDGAWDYPRGDADPDGTRLRIELAGRDLKISFATACLSPTDQHTVRPALVDRATTLVLALASPT